MNIAKAAIRGVVLVALGLFALQSPSIAGPGDPGYATETEPLEVGKAGAHGDGTPKDPKKVDAKTASGGAAGDVTMKLKNTSGEDVTDVHVKIKIPKDCKISEISTSKPGGSPFTENEPDGSGDPESEAVAKVPAQGTNSLADDDTVTVDVSVVCWDEATEEWVDVANTDVQFEIWWTRGDGRNIVVSATSSEQIGDGDPRTTLASMNTTHSWGFDFSVFETAEYTASLNDLAIAECDGFRFQEGSLVLRPTNSTRFNAASLESFSISARSEDNDNVLGTGRFSAGEPRIDSRGNFVIDITRSQSDTEHIVIVLSGLKVEDLSGHEAGQKVYADVSGAAVAGYCMHRYFHLLTVVE
ncbi:MAG: hypothetical protein K8I27_16560 [Planctomycetes bacterium]|nr:hypothetical protein [Planctomycetota bacterium]